MHGSPQDYQEAAFLIREAAEELLVRLQFLTIQPRYILNMSAAGSNLTQQLQRLYPQACILQVDVGLIADIHPGQFTAQATQLPLRNNSIDLLVANCCLPWISDAAQLLAEWVRVLTTEGVLLFNALGLDTLQEYQAHWHNQIIPRLSDMHNLGDSLLQLGLLDPVLDVNHYQVNYQEAAKMLRELQLSGFLKPSIPTASLTLPATLTFEIIQAHAFAAKKQAAAKNHDGITKIPVATLRQSIRNKKL